MTSRKEEEEEEEEEKEEEEGGGEGFRRGSFEIGAACLQREIRYQSLTIIS